MPLPLRLFSLKICQQNRQHHKLFSLITAAGQRESSPPLHFRRFFVSNIPPDNEFGTTTEGSSSAKQEHVKRKLNEQEQGPLMPTSQVLQMSEKLIQLALTATNLANELIQRNCTSDQMQMQRPPKMDETLVRSHQMQRPPKMDETLVRSHQMQRLPKTDETLVRSHQMQRPPKTDETLRSMNARELKEVGNGVGENAVDATEHHHIESHRTLMGVWQCANCKRDNGKLNDVCFKCGAEKSVGKPKTAKRENATKKIGGAANETEDWRSLPNYEEVGQCLKKSRIASLALDEKAGKNWMRDDFFDTEFAKPTEAVVAEAQKIVEAVEEEQPISDESDDNKPNEAVVTEAQKTVEAVEEEQSISAKNESDGKLGAVFLAGSTEEK